MFMNSYQRKLLSKTQREDGFSIVEMLVVLAIMAVLTLIVAGAVVLLRSSSGKVQTTTTSQNELNVAMNTIQRDVSQASGVTYAGQKAIKTFWTGKGNKSYQTYVFVYTGSSDSVPAGADTSNLPPSTTASQSVIEQTFTGGDSSQLLSQNTLVSGYNPANGSNSQVFSYFTQDGTALTVTDNNKTLSNEQLGTLSRVQFNLRSLIDDRTTPVELASAATIGSFVQGLNNNNVIQPIIPAAPQLTGSVSYASNSSDGDVTNTLNWNIPGGATSYTIYVKDLGPNPSNSSLDCRQSLDAVPLTTISNPDIRSYSTTTLTDKSGAPKLIYGNTYCYYMTSAGSGGVSDFSNAINLTIRPPKTQFVNINTKASLNATKNGGGAESGTGNPSAGQTYTVARDLTNQVTWAPSNGATGYRIYRDGSLITSVPLSQSTLSYQDGNVGYGQTHTYTVVPFNGPGQYASGGTAVPSDPVTLISPPIAATLGITEYNSNSGNPQNTVRITGPGGTTTAQGNELYKVSNVSCGALNDTGVSMATAVGTTYQDSVNFGSGTCYMVRSYNDAGYGPNSNTVVATVQPGAFTVTNFSYNASLTDQANGYYYTVARGLKNQVAWTRSAGAQGYLIYRSTNSSCASTSCATQVGQTDGNTNSWTDTNVTYGNIWTYFVVSYAGWSGYNTKYEQSGNTATLVSPPTTPSISANALDNGTSGTNSQNNVYASGSQNANAYRLYANYADASTASCNTNNLKTGNWNGGGYGDTSVKWGQATCYTAVAFNGAGDSPSASTTVLQMPSVFNISTAEVRQYSSMYVSAAGGWTVTNAAGDNDNRNQSLGSKTSWSASQGRDHYDVIVGYNTSNPASSRRSESWTNQSNNCSSGNNSLTSGVMNMSNYYCAQGGTSTSFSTTDLSPGSYYTVQVIVTANDGLKRQVSTQVVTSPVAPRYASTYRYFRTVDTASASNGTAYMADVSNISKQTTYGTYTNIQGFTQPYSDRDNSGSSVKSPNWNVTNFSNSNQSLSNGGYMTISSGAQTATKPTLVFDGAQCAPANGNCDVFVTKYDNGNGDTHQCTQNGTLNNMGNGTKGSDGYNCDMTWSYNRSCLTNDHSRCPARYQFGNNSNMYFGGGAKSTLTTGSVTATSMTVGWTDSMRQVNCFVSYCFQPNLSTNPTDPNVTAGSSSGPWTAYYDDMYSGSTSAHQYYFISSGAGTSPTTDEAAPDSGEPGASIPKQQFATGGSTSDHWGPNGNLPN